jgi:hypothetical protein
MYRPFIRTNGAKAIAGQIRTFANTHAGVANQQQDIQIFAAEELLLEELILLCCERPWKSLW